MNLEGELQLLLAKSGQARMCVHMFCVCARACVCAHTCVEAAKDVPEIEVRARSGSREVVWLYGDRARVVRGWRMGCVGNVAGRGVRETGRDQSGGALGHSQGLRLVGRHHGRVLSREVAAPRLGG